MRGHFTSSNFFVACPHVPPIPTRHLPLGAHFLLTGTSSFRSRSHSFLTHRVRLEIGNVRIIMDMRRESRRVFLRRESYSGSFFTKLANQAIWS
jgi:hypothetical protein